MSDLSKTCERLGNRAAASALATRLKDLDGYWLEFRCSCGRAMTPAVHLLIGRFGGHWRLKDIVSRVSCQQCRAKPVAAYLNETHNRLHDHGAPPGWSVQILPWDRGPP